MANTFAQAYRAAQQITGGACPIEAGILGRLADHDCRHDRQPGDPGPPCGCWPEEGAAVIALSTGAAEQPGPAVEAA
jgi:hypothetical protein